MHPTEIELQALIDGELDRAAAERLRSHVEGCPDCAARLEAMELAVEETGVLLAALDESVPEVTADALIERAEARRVAPRPAPRRQLLAASVAALVVAGVVAAAVVPGSPLRGLLDRLGGGVETAVDVEPAVGWGQRAGVAIVPSAGLEIVFASDQADGTVELAATAGDTARVEVRSDSVGFRVGGRSILVENEAARASYRITLPDDLPAARIRVGDRAVYERRGGEVLKSAFDDRESVLRFPLDPGRAGRP